MERTIKKRSIITAALLCTSFIATGAGYQLNLQGLRQLAMGGGGTAMPWDAATIFYNPGGLAQIEGMQVNASVLAILPRVQYVEAQAGGSTARSVDQTFTPFNLYVGGTIREGSRLGLGLGIYTPFGSGLKWDDNWQGRYITRNINLQTIFVQPTASYRLSDIVSVGAGFVYAFGNVKLSRALPFQNAAGVDGAVELKGNAHGTGFNVGINLKASEALHLGISYRSKVYMDVSGGDATFTVPTALNASIPADNKFDATLPLPEVLSVGAAWKPTNKLTLQLDFNLTGWKVYKELAFDFETNTPALPDSRAPRNYENRLASRLGAHYQATQTFAVMIGGAYDPSPVADNYVSPDLPDANRIVLTGGFTVKPAKRLTILAAVEYVTSEKRNANYAEANFGGRYQTKALTPGIGLSYDFR